MSSKPLLCFHLGSVGGRCRISNHCRIVRSLVDRDIVQEVGIVDDIAHPCLAQDDSKVAVFCTLIVMGWLEGDKDSTYIFFKYVKGFGSDVSEYACDCILLACKDIKHDSGTIATVSTYGCW